MSTSTPAPLKRKAATIVVQETKVPRASTDILTLFQSNTAAQADTANVWTIDVFPNMIPIMMYIMIMSLQQSNTVHYRDHAKASVATICMYHLSVVYGYFLLNDLFTRPNTSAHARSWSEISWKKDFVNFLLRLPVPEFLIPILSQFTTFTTDRTKNVFFCPSAAGYDHNIFFGRIFPMSMFAAIHDCTATLPGNSPRNQVYADLFSRILYSIDNPAFTCLIPDLIGVTIDQTTVTTANSINSRFSQIFNTVFNPVLFRDFQRRSTLAVLGFMAPAYPTNHINAYDLMFSATSANLRELQVILQSITAIFDGIIPCKQTLSELIDQQSGPAIIKHGYSTFALPIWSHSDNNNKSTLFSAVTNHRIVTEQLRAQDICFLQRPAAAFPAHTQAIDVHYATTAEPNVPVDLPANHRLVRHRPLSLRHDAPNPIIFPAHDTNDLVAFDDTIDVAPLVLVLDTDGDLTITAHLALLAGKIIESFEIDGTTIEMPNAYKSLGMQNCMFADSAISYRYVRPGSSFRPQAVGSINPPLARAPPNARPRLPAASLLHDRIKVMLPVVNPTIADAIVPANIPGFTRKEGVSYLQYAQSFIGFRTVDAANHDENADMVYSMDAGKLLLWSPYSYTPYESDDLPLPDLSASRHYFLTNLRTIFGTDFNLVRAKHPYEAMPVV